MPANYDQVDILITPEGDFSIDGVADINNSQIDQIQGWTNWLQTFIASNSGDWEINPFIGADLDEFIGEPNNRETAEKIRLRIFNTLVNNNLVAANDLDVRIIPIDRHTIMIVLKMQVQTTENNSIKNGQVLINFLFDFQETGIHGSQLAGGKLRRNQPPSPRHTLRS